jgi:putative copper resistance protein D
VIGYLAAARAIHLASLMSIFGASAYVVLLQRADYPRPPERAARALLVSAATLALASGLMWFCLIAGQMSGSWANSTDLPTLELAASSTRFGHIFMTRGAGLAALWLLCAFTRSNWPTVAVLAGLLLASLGPASHAAAAINGDVAIAGATNDAVHLLMAGFWLGGLMALALTVPQHGADPAELLGPLRIFSQWGTLAVALLVMTGVINAVSILPLSAMALHNSYFRLLCVKVGLALTMIALASLNRWGITPAIRDGRPRAAGHLAGSVGTEIALGMTIVGITGLLGLIAPH